MPVIVPGHAVFGPGPDDRGAPPSSREPDVVADLVSRGIEAGDRVAVLSRNRGEYLEVFLACAWVGALNEVVLRWVYTSQPDPEQSLPALRRLLLQSIGISEERIRQLEEK